MIRNRFMPIATTMPQRPGAADAFIDARLAAGVVGFPLADLVKETGLSPTAAKSQLLRLGKWVVKVTRKHQFYLIVSPDHQTVGSPANWWLNDYFKWLGHPCYLALQSAAETYGSAPQALQVTQVMTDTSRREIVLGRLLCAVLPQDRDTADANATVGERLCPAPGQHPCGNGDRSAPGTHPALEVWSVQQKRLYLCCR